MYKSLNKYDLISRSVININTDKNLCYKILTKVKNFVKADVETEC